MRHLLSTADLSRADALAVLDTAEEMAAVNQREVKKLPTLRGRTVINLFFEDSTRTRTSFELAGKRLGADVINMSVSNSSVNKGETLLDTLRITCGWAWTYLVVAELVAANSGLGYAILKAQRYMHTDKIFAGILLIGLIGLITDQAFRWLHRRAFPWMRK